MLTNLISETASSALAIPWLLFSLYARDDLDVSVLEKRYTDSTSRFLEVDGMRVHYRDEGEGPVLLLLHGTFSSLHTWDAWTAHLKEHFRVIRLDLPGFGLTGPPTYDNYHAPTYSRFLADFLDCLGVARCHIGGNSLGGRLAWQFALDYPERTDKLVLVSAAGYLEHSRAPQVFRWARRPLTRSLVRYVTPRHLIVRSLHTVYHNPTIITPQLIRRYHELMLRQGNRAAFVELANAQYGNNARSIRHVSAPTLILWGDRDEWIPVAHGYLFKRDIQDARLIVYSKVGHVPMEEAADKSAEDVRCFLSI